MVDRQEKPPDGPSPAAERLIELGRAHLALGAALFVSTLSVLKLLRVSGGDPTTALAILQAGGTSTVATAMLVSIAPLLLAIVFGGTVLEWLESLDGRPSAEAIGLLCVVALVIALVVPTPICIAVLVVAGIACWTRRRGTEHASQDREEPMRGGVVMAVVLGCLFVVISGPWWPAEVVERRDGTTEVAHVIGVDPQEIVLLGVDDTLVRRYPRSDVVGRRLCDDRSWWHFDGRSPVALLMSPSYEPCP